MLFSISSAACDLEADNLSWLKFASTREIISVPIPTKMSEKTDRSPSPTRSLKDTTGSAGTAGSVGGTTNVQVAVRCRPMNAEEKKLNQPSAVTCDIESKAVTVNFGAPGKKVTKNYAFDMLFGMYSTQDEVFQVVAKPIVDEALAGFNCTIFAYGQTGTEHDHSSVLAAALEIGTIAANIWVLSYRHWQDAHYGR